MYCAEMNSGPRIDFSLTHEAKTDQNSVRYGCARSRRVIIFHQQIDLRTKLNFPS